MNATKFSLLLAPLIVATLLAGSEFGVFGALHKAHAAEAVADDIIEKTGAFASDVEEFLMELGLEHEDFAVRLNRCDGAEDRNDVFYVWVGARAIAPQANAADILNRLRDRWRQQDWIVYRYKQLPNGGVNIAARDPRTGNAYSLDSGFEAGPDTYVAGFFNTPCFINPDGDVAFGPVDGGRRLPEPE